MQMNKSILPLLLITTLLVTLANCYIIHEPKTGYPIGSSFHSPNCKLKEAGYLKQYVDTKKVPWYLFELRAFEPGDLVLGSIGIYVCESDKSRGVVATESNAPVFYVFENSLPWCKFISSLVVDIMESWRRPDGQLFVTKDESQWIKDLGDSTGFFVKAKSTIYMHWTPSDETLELSVNGGITFKRRIPATQFYRIVGIFKRSAFAKTI
jgi:hypothetical protein